MENHNNSSESILKMIDFAQIKQQFNTFKLNNERLKLHGYLWVIGEIKA